MLNQDAINQLFNSGYDSISERINFVNAFFYSNYYKGLGGCKNCVHFCNYSRLHMWGVKHFTSHGRMFGIRPTDYCRMVGVADDYFPPIKGIHFSVLQCPYHSALTFQKVLEYKRIYDSIVYTKKLAPVSIGEHTNEELINLRKDLFESRYGKEEISTCDTCECAGYCLGVYDPYNINGDCIESK